MKEEVIVQRLYFSHRGERKYFQVQLPSDSKRVIGFEYGVMPDEGSAAPPIGIDPVFQIHPNERIGQLAMQIQGCESHLFQFDLVKDTNIHSGDTISPKIWEPLNWTHGRRREELELDIQDADWVEGLFVNERQEGEHYYLHLYLWIEKCEP
jgi:hypothetical protein